MVDELYERYRHLSHADLYRQLRAGSPTQLDEMATGWRRAEDALRALTASLRQDLTALQVAWTGAGSQEYQHRLRLVASWAEALLAEAVAIRTGLSLMSNLLADAQRRAEPDQADLGEWTFDGVLGPALGHTATATEQSRSHERLARLVAELAAGYAVADHQTWPAALPDVPLGLPGAEVAGLTIAGTQLAGAVVEHIAPAGPVSAAPPHLIAPPAAPIASPAAPVTAASMLAGTGSVLAAASSHLVGGNAPHRVTAESAPAAASAPIPPMAGAGMMGGAPPPTTVAGYHRPFDDATSWSAGEHALWGDDSDEAPPAVLGDPS